MRNRIVALLLALLMILPGIALAGTSASLNQQMATRSGPGTKYTEELGTFPITTGISVVSQVDSNGTIWYQVEFKYDGKLYRAYTGKKRVNAYGSIPWENDLYTEDVTTASVKPYYGPGDRYAKRRQTLDRGATVRVFQVEGDWALCDFREGNRWARGYINVSDLKNTVGVALTPTPAPVRATMVDPARADWTNPVFSYTTQGRQNARNGYFLTADILNKVIRVNESVGGWTQMIAPFSGDYSFSVATNQMTTSSFSIRIYRDKGSSKLEETDKLRFVCGNGIVTKVIHDVKMGETLYWWEDDDTNRGYTNTSSFLLMISAGDFAGATPEPTQAPRVYYNIIDEYSKICVDYYGQEYCYKGHDEEFAYMVGKLPVMSYFDGVPCIRSHTQVFSGPGDHYWCRWNKNGSGYAYTGTLDTNLRIYGQENGWIMIRYPSDANGGYRYGWVIPQAISVANQNRTPKVDFAYLPAITTRFISATDDPDRSLEYVGTNVEENVTVTALAFLNEDRVWVYCEYRLQEGNRSYQARGFIPASGLQLK